MAEMIDFSSGSAEEGRLVGRAAAVAPLSLLRAAWKRKITLLLTWLLVSAGTLVVVWRLPSIYHSEALILVESQRIPERFVATTVNVDLQDRLNTISQQILSYERLRRIVQQFDLYAKERRTKAEEEIIEMMRDDISIAPVKGWTQTQAQSQNRPGAFRVAFEGPNPAVVAQVANELSGLFIGENLKARDTQARGVSEFLDSQVADARKKLLEQESKLSEFKLKFNGELPEQEQQLLATLTRLQSQLSTVQESISRTQQSKTVIESSLDTAQASEAALTQIAAQASEAARAPQRAAATVQSRTEVLQERLDALRLHYSDDHPDVRALKAELARLEKQQQGKVSPGAATGAGGERDSKTAAGPEANGGNPQAEAIEGEVGKTAPQFAQSLLNQRERVESIRAQLTATDQQLKSLEAERKRVTAEMQALEKRVERLPLREQQIAEVMRDYQISKANYQSLLDKNLSAEMATEMEMRQKAERFTQLEQARVPEKPIKPNRPILNLAGCGVGLALGILLAFGKEMKANAVLGEWELPGGIAVMGHVPMIVPAVAEGVRASGVPAPGRKQKPRRRRMWLVSLAVIVVVGACTAAGFFFLRGGF